MSANRIEIRCLVPGMYDERRAAGAMKPGHVVQVNSAGAVVVHATLGIPGERLVVKEDALQGKTVADAYASGDLVPLIQGLPNDVLQLRVAAAAPAIVIGDKLTLAADGTVKKRTVTGDTYTDAGAGASTFAQEQAVFAIADEAVDNSAGASEVFIKARLR